MYFKVIKWIEPFMEIKHFLKGWCLNFLGRYLKSFGSSLLFGCFRLCLCCFVIVWNSPKRNHFSSYYQVSKNIQFFDNFLGLEILKFSIFSYFCLLAAVFFLFLLEVLDPFLLSLLFFNLILLEKVFLQFNSLLFFLL